jgi:hypothetical protein
MTVRKAAAAPSSMPLPTVPSAGERLAVAGEFPVANELIQYTLTLSRVQIEKTGRLRKSELQPWHLGELRPQTTFKVGSFLRSRADS